jgi:uncharacterized protein (TIGR00269 family)
VRCRVCGGEAVVRLEYANLRLCGKHFVEFFERRVLRTVERYGMLREGQRVAVAVSGGKDSVSLLHALWKLRERLGVELVGVTIDLGIRGYSEEYVGVAVENFERLGVPYRVVRLADYGFTIDDAAERLRRPVCSVCGTVKRYLLNRVARELGANVVATGHTLDDFLSVLLQAYIRGDLELLSKHKPYLPPADGLVARAKPLAETPESDTLTYARILGLRFTERKCPYAGKAVSADYKAALNLLEERHPGIKFQMLRSFLDRVQPRVAAGAGAELRKCEVCGEPSSSRVCQFCRFRAQLAGERLRLARAT